MEASESSQTCPTLSTEDLDDLIFVVLHCDEEWKRGWRIMSYRRLTELYDKLDAIRGAS